MVVICVISFSIDHKMSDIVVGKSSLTHISIEMKFGQYQADFIAKIFKKIEDKIEQRLIDAGMALVNRKTIDVPIED